MSRKGVGGRPKAFTDPKELNRKVEEYFDQMEKEDRPPTYAGLAYHLGVDRRTVYSYRKTDEFLPTMKKASQRIGLYMEEKLINEGKAGQIFLAKNYGYTDRQEIDHSGGLNIRVEWADED